MFPVCDFALTIKAVSESPSALPELSGDHTRVRAGRWVVQMSSLNYSRPRLISMRDTNVFS